MENLVGKRFGSLIVLKDSGKRNNEGRIIWECICFCGNLKEVNTKGLTSGKTRSCDCLRREKMRTKMLGSSFGKKHGDCADKIPLYKTWKNIKARCYQKSHHKYKNYGARGIKVCPSWKNNYIKFKKWALSHGYKKGLSIHRINNDGNYSPKNCQWLTISEHAKKAKK